MWKCQTKCAIKFVKYTCILLFVLFPNGNRIIKSIQFLLNYITNKCTVWLSPPKWSLEIAAVDTHELTRSTFYLNQYRFLFKSMTSIMHELLYFIKPVLTLRQKLQEVLIYHFSIKVFFFNGRFILVVNSSFIF